MGNTQAWSQSPKVRDVPPPRISDCHRWLCTSTKPGNTILPVASTILAPELSSPLPTATMRLSSMDTSPPEISPSSPSPSRGSIVMTRCALRMRVRRIAGLLCSRLSMRCVVVRQRQLEHLLRYLEGGLISSTGLGSCRRVCAYGLVSDGSGLDHGIGHFRLFAVDSEVRAPALPSPKSPRTSSAASDRKSAPLPLSRQAG